MYSLSVHPSTNSKTKNGTVNYGDYLSKLNPKPKN
jgi:hypothetical protein